MEVQRAVAPALSRNGTTRSSPNTGMQKRRRRKRQGGHGVAGSGRTDAGRAFISFNFVLFNIDKPCIVHTMEGMAKITWSIEKERLLKKNAVRGNVGFTDCVIAIDEGRVLDDLPHPTRSNQRLLILNIENYAYVVPYIVQGDGSWLFKTVFPSRKHTALYLMRK